MRLPPIIRRDIHAPLVEAGKQLASASVPWTSSRLWSNWKQFSFKAGPDNSKELVIRGHTYKSLISQYVIIRDILKAPLTFPAPLAFSSNTNLSLWTFATMNLWTVVFCFSCCCPLKTANKWVASRQDTPKTCGFYEFHFSSFSAGGFFRILRRGINKYKAPSSPSNLFSLHPSNLI